MPAGKKKVPQSRKPMKVADLLASLGDLDRRREWRFSLPLLAQVEGTLPRGQKFREDATIENISSTGAYFYLESCVAVGSRLIITIDLPKEISGEKSVRLQLSGLTIRLEESKRKGKKQGVAVRFYKDYKLIPADGSGQAKKRLRASC